MQRSVCHAFLICTEGHALQGNVKFIATEASPLPGASGDALAVRRCSSLDSQSADRWPVRGAVLLAIRTIAS